VRALQGMFPTIYETIGLELTDAIIDLKAKSPKHELPHKRRKQLSVLLLDAGAMDKPLAQVLQGHFSQTDANEAPGKQVNISAESVDLPTRKIEAR